MAIPILTKNPTSVKTGPGYILLGPANPTEPTWVATASKFTNAIPGMFSAGYTAEGMTFSFGARETVTLTPAEEYEPIRIITTGIAPSTAGFDAYGVDEVLTKYALNGGTWATVSGATTTLVRSYVPADPGSETRCAFVFVSSDTDEIIYIPQALQTGEVTRTFTKGDETSGYKGLVFSSEKGGISSFSWKYLTAGAGFIGPTVTP